MYRRTCSSTANMKSLIIITVLAALAVCYAASVPDEVHRSDEDFIVYKAGTRDNNQAEVIFHEQLYYHSPIWGSTVSQEVIYSGNATVQIMGFIVTRPPAVIFHEFLGSNGLQVKLVSNPGQALNSNIIIFGNFSNFKGIS